MRVEDLEPAAPQVAVGVGGRVEVVALLGRPGQEALGDVDQLVGVAAVGERGVAARRQRADLDLPGPRGRLTQRHAALHDEPAGHVDLQVAQERRSGRRGAAPREPPEDLGDAVGDGADRGHGDDPAHEGVGLRRAFVDARRGGEVRVHAVGTGSGRRTHRRAAAQSRRRTRAVARPRTVLPSTAAVTATVATRASPSVSTLFTVPVSSSATPSSSSGTTTGRVKRAA